jgi:hypothetical protein
MTVKARSLFLVHSSCILFRISIPSFLKLCQTNLLGHDRSQSTEEVTFSVNDDGLGGEGHLWCSN